MIPVFPGREVRASRLSDPVLVLGYFQNLCCGFVPRHISYLIFRILGPLEGLSLLYFVVRPNFEELYLSPRYRISKSQIARAMPMRAIVLFSGGKDSCLAVWFGMHQSFEISKLLTIVVEDPYSHMFHYPNAEWASIQAQAMGLPLETHRVSRTDELLALKAILSSEKASTGSSVLIHGAVESEYQKSRIDKICEQIGMKAYAPLWKKDPKSLLSSMLNGGFEVMISGVYAMGFDPEWLGRMIDREAIDDLIDLNERYQVNLMGEGGEFETFVTDYPMFTKKVLVEKFEKVWKGDHGYLKIGKALLADKP